MQMPKTKKAAGPKPKQKTLSNTELFKMFDKDESGSINYDEFVEISRFMNLNLSRERAMKIFSEADADASGWISYDEFESALVLLRREVSQGGLAKLGYSTAVLVGTFVSLVGLMGGFFVFIFVGMSAFTTGTTFGS